MTEVLIPLNLLMIIAGLYVVQRVSPREAIYTGVAVCVGMALLRVLFSMYTDVSGIPVYFLSCLLAALPFYWLVNRLSGYIAPLFVLPIGTFLLLVGGPLEIILTVWQAFTEINAESATAAMQVICLS